MKVPAISREQVRALNAKLPMYCTAELSRHNKLCVYFRRIGLTGRIRIQHEPLSPAFWRTYAALMAGEASKCIAASPQQRQAAPRTWRWLCTQYFSSTPFKRLQSRGQRVRRSMLSETWDEPLGPTSSLKFADIPLERLQAKAIRVLRDRKLRWKNRQLEDGTTEQVETNIEAANSRLKYIRAVLAWAAEEHEELVKRNWAKDVPYLKSGSKGWHTWTLDEIEQFEACHPIGSKARLAMALGLYGGQRRGDIARMGRVQERNGVLQIIQEKNRRVDPVTAWVPIVPALQKIIDASPTGDFFFIVQNNGQPYAKESLGNLVRKWCKEAGLPHCSLHGLRKACVVRLIMDDCTPHEIMAVTGHRTLKEIDRYARDFMREAAANSVREKWFLKHSVAAA